MEKEKQPPEKSGVYVRFKKGVLGDLGHRINTHYRHRNLLKSISGRFSFLNSACCRGKRVSDFLNFAT